MDQSIVRNEFPTPIAERYATARTDGSLGAAVNTFEVALEVLLAAAVGAYLDRRMPEDVRRAVWEMLRGGRWTDGPLVGLLREASSSLPEEGLRELGWTRERCKEALARCDRLISERNDDHGHSPDLGDAATRAKAPGYLADVERLFDEVPGLRDREVWVPRHVDNRKGLIVHADVYRGLEPRRNVDVRNVGVKLDRDRRDVAGGPVREGATPLLVDRAQRSAVALVPFVTCHEGALWFLGGVAFDREGGVSGATYKTYGRSERFEAPLWSYEVSRVGALVAAVRPRQNAHGLGLPAVWAEQAEHLRGFIGRARVRRDLARWATDPAQRGYCVVLGPPGQGKSALLARLAADLGAADPVEGVLRGGSGGEAGPSPKVVLHHVKQAGDPVTILRSLLDQARALAGVRSPRREPEGVVALRNALVETLTEVPGGAVLVVDALDELDGLDLTFLPPRLPSGVRGVLSCRPGVPLLDVLRGQVDPRDEWELGPLGREDLDTMLVSQREATVAGEIARGVDLDVVHERTQGNAILMRAAVRVLIDAHASGTLRGAEARVPQTLHDEFRRQVREATGKVAKDRQVLGTLSVARAPLSPRAVYDVLRVGGGATSYDEVGGALESLSELLTSSAEGHRLYHEGLAEYVREQVLGPELPGAHETLAAWARVGGTEEGAAYGRLHRARHLIEALKGEESGGGDGGRIRDKLLTELTSWDPLTDSADHGALDARGQGYLAAVTEMPSSDRDEIEAWGEVVRAEAGRCTSADDLLQQVMLLPTDHPTRLAAEGAEAGRPLLIPLEQPETAALPGRLALGAGPEVTRIAPFDGGFAVFRDREMWAFDWEGRSVSVAPEAFEGQIDKVDVAVPLGGGRYEVRQRPDVQAAVTRDPGPEQAGATGPSKPVAVLDDGLVVVASNDALRVHHLGTETIVAEIAVDDLFRKTRDEVGLDQLQVPTPLNVRPVTIHPAPRLAALAGGRHVVVWAVKRVGSEVAATYAVWEWDSADVVWRVESRRPTGPLRRKDRRMGLGVPRESSLRAEPFVLGGSPPRFVLRDGTSGVSVFDAAAREVWEFDYHQRFLQPLSASPDGRFMYDLEGQVWEVETGKLVGRVQRGKVLGFAADGQNVLWDRSEPEPPEDGSECHLGDSWHTLRVSGLDGSLRPCNQPTRSDGNFYSYAAGPEPAASAALGVEAAAVPYDDGSVRIVPLSGADCRHSQSLYRGRHWMLRSAARGVVTSMTHRFGVEPDHQWQLLDTGEEGDHAVRTDHESGWHRDWSETAPAHPREFAGPTRPHGEIWGEGGHMVVGGDPHAFVAYALRSELGVAEVRLENLRTGEGETLGRFSYAEHDPCTMEMVSTREDEWDDYLIQCCKYIDFVILQDRRVALILRDRGHLQKPGGGVIYLPTASGMTPIYRVETLFAVETTQGGEFVLVDGTEPNIEIQLDPQDGVESTILTELPRLVVLDTQTGAVVRLHDRGDGRPPRLMCVDGDVALLSLGGQLVAWDWATDSVVAKADMPSGFHAWFGAVRQPGEIVVVCTEARGTRYRFGCWAWSSAASLRWLGAADLGDAFHRHDVWFGGASESVSVITAGNRLSAVDLETGGVATALFGGDVEAAVWNDEVVAIDHRGLYRFRIEPSSPTDR